jgi:hypothetical protein
LYLNEPPGQSVDPGIDAYPTTRENQRMLATTINDR